MKVAIVGNGWVGKGMQDLFPDALVYIRNTPPNDQNRFTDNKDEINKCDIAFVCVPTPNMPAHPDSGTEVYKGIPQEEGKLDTSIVEEVIEWLKTPIIVVRSTVNPGDCDRWQDKYNKAIVFQPEYLGETPSHPLLDTTQTNFIIIGSNRNKIGTIPDGVDRKVIELYQTVYNANTKIRSTSLKEAEIIKLSENRAIAYKVAQAQELYDVCELAGVDYYTIREAVYSDDPRMNLWWTFVYPDKRGFNSKCIPKDIYAWCAWAESLGYEPKITRAILEKNKEWIK